MPHDEDRTLHPDCEQRIEIPDQQGTPSELEEALGAVPRRRSDAFADAPARMMAFINHLVL